jgi:hypothetical protein
MRVSSREWSALDLALDFAVRDAWNALEIAGVSPKDISARIDRWNRERLALSRVEAPRPRWDHSRLTWFALGGQEYEGDQ